MPVEAPLYPINLVLSGRRCLVVGGGRVAKQKVMGLLEAEAEVHLIAPDAVTELQELDGLAWDQRPYQRGDVVGHHLVITATDDPEVNHQVAVEAEGAGIWVNSADDPANCTFILPARIRQGPLLVTFSTGGTSPAVSTWLRRRFAEEFGPEYAKLIELLAEERATIQRDGLATEGLDWQTALDSGMLDLIREGNLAEAKERLQACLSSSSD